MDFIHIVAERKKKKEGTLKLWQHTDIYTQHTDITLQDVLRLIVFTNSCVEKISGYDLLGQRCSFRSVDSNCFDNGIHVTCSPATTDIHANQPTAMYLVHSAS
mmetsp:Transcript_95184/g.139007  ORF Transcript_95184/g.139007 Transcript_95184/m.139007 type:complete len:103 (-) Transcript_95184:150-458(-)